MKGTLFIKTRSITSLVVLLMTLPVWGNDGDTFSEKTVEGVLLKYTIISESEKTCMVGDKYYPAVPAARATGIRRGPEEEVCQASGDITIPEEANGYRVVRIESYAFNQAAITSVFIPSSVETIGFEAFTGCADLKSVRLPLQLKSIESFTFYGCESLTSIDIPEGVTSIGEYAFANCKQMKEVNIPSSVTHFGGSVFWNTGFTSLPKLPDNLTTIPNGMFYQCTQLTSIEIPQNITRIGDTAFGRCPISEIEIPVSVVHIGVAAFANCKNLTNIVIPDNVMSIGMNGFLGCSGLKTVKLSNNLSSLSNGVFSDCTILDSINIPNGVKTIGEMAFMECSSLTTISIPETVESINNRAFFGCSSLTQLFIPKSVVSIDTRTDWALLYACNSLTSIIVDEDNPVYDSRNNCNAIIETASNKIIAGCTTTTIPEGITAIGYYAFSGFENLRNITLPQSLERIETGAFTKLGLQIINIPENVTSIESYAFNTCKQLETVKIYIKEPIEIPENAFKWGSSTATLYVPKGTVDKYKAAKGWNVFSSIIENTEPEVNIAYRPFVEEDKVWKVGDYSGNPVKRVEYYYFDGVIIIDGRTCKQMMRKQYVNPEHPDYDVITQYPLLSYVGAWYEEDKKVYLHDSTTKQFKLMYDFSVDANETLQINNNLYVIGPKQTGEMKGFKLVYRDVMWGGGELYNTYNTTWLEGVGGIDGPTANVYYGKENHPLFLMSCTVDDEVIYLNDEYEDGATPGDLNGKKQRFDFTHTIKTKPKAPKRREKRGERRDEMQSLYGEYNEQKLDINLDPLDDAYLVSITDESGKTVYEKAINAGAIVALNIDISSYAEGRYTVTVENSGESFTGIFDTNTTGIKENVTIEKLKDNRIYNLQGQRMSSLRRGVNIVNGRKVYVK